MLTIVIISSLFGAFCNALAAILQRQVAGNTHPSRLFRFEFLKELFMHRWWLIGGVLDVFGFLFQALALWKGSLVVIMPIMAMDFVFLMLLLHFRYKIIMGKREWWAVVAVTLGISGFIISADPQSGNVFGNNGIVWLVVIASIAFIVVLGAFFVRRIASSVYRAAITGVITGMNFALSAVLTKVVVEQFTNGFWFLLSHWFVYALIASLIIGFINIQNTFGAGSLAISQPALGVSGPIVSIALGAILFGDMIRLTPGALAAEIISIAVLSWGIVLLARSEKFLYSRL